MDKIHQNNAFLIQLPWNFSMFNIVPLSLLLSVEQESLYTILGREALFCYIFQKNNIFRDL